MSMELFLICIEGVGQATFKRAVAQEILGRDALESKRVLDYRVDYPDGSGAEVCCAEGDDLESICFDRFGGEIFFDRVWELADRIGAVIFWPAPGPSTAVTHPAMIDRLPDELRGDEDMPVVVVRSGGDIYNAIEESFPPII
jgi:hypothetical protein